MAHDESQNSIAVPLLLFLFIVYIVLSVLVTLVRIPLAYIQRWRTHGLTYRDAAVFSFLFIVIYYILPQHGISTWNVVTWVLSTLLESSKPIVLKVFGFGGQGLLYVWSFYSLEYENLSLQELLPRVFAGGASAVLLAIFFIPLLLGVLAYLVPLLDAAYQGERHNSKAPSPQLQSPPNLEDAIKIAWICPYCETVNKANVCSLCESPRNPRIVQAKTKGYRENENVSLDAFDMNCFVVLSLLGSGVTCIVALARLAVKAHSAQKTPEESISMVEKDFVKNDNNSLHNEYDLYRYDSSIAKKEPNTKVQKELSTSYLSKTSKVMRTAASVPSKLDLYGAGSEWKTNQIKWINQEISSDENIGLGLTNSGVPYSDIHKHVKRSNVTKGDQKHSIVSRSRQDEATRNKGNLQNLQTLQGLFAIKTINKQKIEAMGMRENVEHEIELLKLCDSPFICKMYSAFQDRLCVHLVLEPVAGGDLASLMQQHMVLYESEAKFYTACLLLALQHLQGLGIVCLDIKPENLLLDKYGYAKLTDLGVARRFRNQKERGRWNYVGTVEYIAPEVVWTMPIAPGFGSFSPDIWATGILIYEMVVGETPFVGETDKDTKRNIMEYSSDLKPFIEKGNSWFKHSLNKETKLDWKDCRVSTQAQELVENLLQVDASKRLGYKGISEIMQHSWFSRDEAFNWEVIQMRVPDYAPLVPEPDSLPPPFRTSEIEEDSTGRTPLTFGEFQWGCEVIAENDATASFDYNLGEADTTWKGLLTTSRPEVKFSEEVIEHTRDLLESVDPEQEGERPRF